MSTGEASQSVGKSVSSIYSKAKQRILNRFGRRTHLTRNPKVDSLNDIQNGISADENKLATKITAYRRALRDSVTTGLDLQLYYISIYKKNVGTLKYSADRSEYTREPTAQQVHFVQQLERELGELESAVKKELELFKARFKDYADHPLTNKSIEEVDELRRIESLKSDYKKTRTSYSDRAIEVERGSTNQAALTEAYQEYMRMSEQLCEEMIRYQERVAREIGSKVRGFFEAQCKIYGVLNEKYQNLLPLIRQLEILPFSTSPETATGEHLPMALTPPGSADRSPTTMTDTINLFE